MLLHVLSYDPKSGYGEAIQASLYRPLDFPENRVINIYSKMGLQPDNTYSFQTKNKWIGQKFIRAELDYTSPHPLSENNNVQFSRNRNGLK